MWGEEVGPDAWGGGGGGWRWGGGGGGHDEGVEVAEEVEVGGEEDVEEARLDEVGCAGDGLRVGRLVRREREEGGNGRGTRLGFVAGLDNGSVDPGDGVREGGEVREEDTVRGELVPEDVEEHELLRGEELGCGEVRGEGEDGEEFSEEGRGGEDGVEELGAPPGRVGSASAEAEVPRDEGVGDGLVELGKVAGGVD